MFNESKYTNCYNRIISTPDQEGERHHIVPRSLGGSDDPSNIVTLSLRKHYIAHLLLTKMVSDTKSSHKMLHALKMMSKTRKINSRAYEIMKNKFRELKFVTIYNPDTEECKYLYDGEDMPLGFQYGGAPKSEEWKEKIRGRKQSPEHISKRIANSAHNKGKKKYQHKVTGEKSLFLKQPDENWILMKKERRSISEARKGQKPYYNKQLNECKLFREGDTIPVGFLLGRGPIKGHKQTAYQKQKVKEANQKTVKITMTDGSVIETTGIVPWVKERDIPVSTFYYKRRLGDLRSYGIAKIEEM